MSLSFEIYLVLVLLLLYSDILIILKLIVNRLKSKGEKEQILQDKKDFINDWSSSKQIEKSSLTYRQLKQSINLDSNDNSKDEELIESSEGEQKCIKDLSSPFKLKRMESAVKLGYIASERARIALESAIDIEKDTPVKLYIANALSDIGDKKSIPVLISTLINTHHWYRNKVNMLLINFGDDFNNHLPQIINRSEAEIKELIIEYARINFSSELKQYLIKITEQESKNYSGLKYERMNKIERCCANCIWGRTADSDGNRVCKYNGTVSPVYKCWRFKRLPVSIDGDRNRQELVYSATEILATYYPKVISEGEYINSQDVKIKNIAVRSLSKGNPFESIEKLIVLLKDEDVASTSVACISKTIDNNPELLQKIIGRFEREKDLRVKEHLGGILSHKIDYFIMKLNTSERQSAREIIEEVLVLGKTSGVIGFLNKNNNMNIENELILIIKQVLHSHDIVLEKEYRQYLNERVLKKLGLNSYKDLQQEKVLKRDQNVIYFIYTTIVFILLLFPIIFILRHSPKVLSLSLGRQLRTYVLDYNYYIAFYSIAISAVNLILIALSVVNVRRQTRLWELKSNSLLFKDRMLPGISIVAPAYNEEKTIIESANSLLNLVYPDYELIIVNDGSVDQTMKILISTFDLKRVDLHEDSKLNTKYVRGVYMNKSMPKLVVVDKENGGKADSLNSGINHSRKEYFCGIDADSILEPDALLKLASRELDAGIETPALGGNVFPANGCTIEKGSIVNKAFPENTLARFQTIEYIRAFMAGRLGWAYSNCLLIISGAFGLFRKERVIDVGGYLTLSGEYSKDTVGEDMELVVRIGRMMREKGLKYKIDYVYNANCWTEVPEDIKSLHKQRNRWHRGLIDILAFHKKMIFNPAYGRAGLIAMPYFFLFEFVENFIEIQGYIMVILAIVLGLMNIEIATLLFVATILLGTMISLASLLIAQKDLEYFSRKDITLLILYSIAENFGPRQLLSIWRFGATMRLLFRQDGWGQVERKGFETSNVKSKES